ncbi:hypothetical protein CRYUN_Cryun22dG0048800 [Craigia yunnanensis]
MDEENKVGDDIESDIGKEFERIYSQPLLIKRFNTTSQIAIVGANACPVESLDYEIAENELFKQDWRSRRKIQIFQYVLLKWAFALTIGLGTGLVGIFNNIAVENIAGFKLLLTTELMLEHKYYKAFAAYAGCNLGLAAAGAALCAFIAPAAAGSGIPEVKAYLNGVDAHSILAPSTLLVKIFGSILGVSAGFVVGKEGPMVYTGSCIASLIGQGGSRKYHLTRRWLRYFKNDRDRRDLITCGAAACVAAAFRAPVGGVLFALEEAASCAPDILVVILLGIIGGIFGSLYNYLVDKVLRTYSIINDPVLFTLIGLHTDKTSAIAVLSESSFMFCAPLMINPTAQWLSCFCRRGAAVKILLVITICLLTSICSYGLPWLATCIPCPTDVSESCPNTDVSGNYKSFQCPSGHYNDLASLFLNTNDDAIRNLLSTSTVKEFHISSLFIFFGAVYCLGIITYGIAIPSGLFIPVILAGACYGRLVASFLGGTMRMTVSLCVILLELTNDLLVLPLVMLVLLISKTVGDIFNKGVYDQIVKLKGLPYMEAYVVPYMKNLVARDVVSGPLITFSGVEKVGNILHVLRTTGHNGFPVIDEPPFSDSPELCGLVLRSHLLVLLKGKIFSRDRILAGDEILRRFAAFDFAKAGSGKGIKVEDLDIEEEDMDKYVDLHPITNASSYTVVETMSLAKAAVLFRQLGLRHMCVVPRSQGRPPIVGILTRHDFMPEHILGLYRHIRLRK